VRKLVDGRTWSECGRSARHAGRKPDVGNRGFSSIGAVVGATQEHTIPACASGSAVDFLLPGYGSQGQLPRMPQRHLRMDARDHLGRRSILYAHREPKYAGLGWQAPSSAPCST